MPLIKARTNRVKRVRHICRLQEPTVRDLLKATLRHRPDRIIVGEVRGALARFASCVLQSGVELPYPAIRRLISESIDLVLDVERRRGVRSVTQVVCVTGYDPERDAYDLEHPVAPTGDANVKD